MCIEFRALFSLPKVTDDIQDELISHIEMRTDANIAAGMTPEEARRDALLRFGNPAVIKEQVAAEAAAMAILGIAAHVKYAFRQLFRNRGFATTAILTLALGIGATTVSNGSSRVSIGYHYQGANKANSSSTKERVGSLASSCMCRSRDRSLSISR